MPAHLHCMPWCTDDHHPINACYTIITSEVIDGVDGELEIGLYGTEEGTYLGVKGYAVHPSQAQTLMPVYQGNRPLLQAIAALDCQPGYQSEHMSFCQQDSHWEVSCQHIVFSDVHATIAIEGSARDQVGLALSPVFAGQPTPMFVPAQGWGSRDYFLAPDGGQELFLVPQELDVLAAHLPALVPYFAGTRQPPAASGPAGRQ